MELSRALSIVAFWHRVPNAAYATHTLASMFFEAVDFLSVMFNGESQLGLRSENVVTCRNEMDIGCEHRAGNAF
jgi:hypothetical protein